MSKVSHAGEDHRHPVFIGGGDHFFVFDRASGLNNRLGAGLGRFVDAVKIGVKCI